MFMKIRQRRKDKDWSKRFQRLQKEYNETIKIQKTKQKNGQVQVHAGTDSSKDVREEG